MLPKPSDLRSATFHVSQSPPGWVVQGYGQESYAGEAVTVEGSLSVPSVLSGFTILMEDTSSLPLITYQRLKRGKDRAYDSPYYALFHDQANPEHTSLVYREIIMGHMLGWGNHYSQKIWDRQGVLRELWPLRPDRMKVFREKGERKYLYTQMNGAPRAFRQDEIWHIPAFGFDGIMGYSRITLARNAIGLAMATEKYGSKTFSNGARPDVVLKSPKELSPEAYKRLQDSWNESYQGADNARKAAVLEDGVDLVTIGFQPDDAQFIETQRWSVDQIARVFRIPPHMLGSVDRSTSWGSGIEQQELGYLSHTLRPWLKRIEQQAHKDLLLDAEKRDLIVEHLVEDFLRTDIGARMTAYVQAITNGIMTRNEARERENLNPIDGLDRMLMPLNMTEVGAAPSNPPKTARGSRIEPLLRDVLERIARRDAHELKDARQRWQAKGKAQKFEAWLEEFYRSDHREFIFRSFQPFIDAEILDSDAVAQFAQDHCEQRGAEVQADELAESPNIDAMLTQLLDIQELYHV